MNQSSSNSRLKTLLGSFFFRYRDGFLVSLVLMFVCGLLLLIWFLPSLEVIFTRGFDQNLPLRFPVYLSIDEQKTFTIVDSNARRIVRADAQGNLLWTALGGKRLGGFYESYRAVGTPDGGAIVYNAVLDEAGDFVTEELQLFSNTGSYLRTLLSIPSSSETIRTIEIRHRELLYYRQNGSRLEVRVLPFGDSGTAFADPYKPETHRQLFNAQCELDFVVASIDGSNGVWLSLRDGSMAELKGNGAVRSFRLEKVQKPWDLAVDTVNGRIIVLDLMSNSVFGFSPQDPSSYESVFEAKEIFDLGIDQPLFEFIALGPDGELGLVDKFNHRLWIKDRDSVIRSFASFSTSNTLVLQVVLPVSLAVVFVITAFWSLVCAIKRFVATQVSIMVKQVSILIPLIVLSVVIGTLPTFSMLSERFNEEVRARLLVAAGLGAQLIPAESVASIVSPADHRGPAHAQLMQSVNGFLNAEGRTWTEDLRAVVYKVLKDPTSGLERFYLVLTSSDYYGVLFPFGSPTRGHLAAARSGHVSTSEYEDEYGSYLCGLAPIRSPDGSVVGVLEVYINRFIFDESALIFRAQLIQAIIIAILLVTSILVLVDILLFKALTSLRYASERVTKGELGIHVPEKRHDEIGDLTRDFNIMSTKLHDYFARLEAIRDANARFVPTAYVQVLGKDDIGQVHAGEETRKRMTLLFSDIRSFTTLSEGMTAAENFSFINEYLSKMGPRIREYGGFIDRYLGDAIQALFPDSPSQALKAAIALYATLHEFNLGRVAAGKPEIHIGVGLHCDELILGILGQERRLSATVVSSAVELVNKLEALTKKYYVDIVLTQPVYDGLEEDQRQLCTPLGTVEYLDSEVPIFGVLVGKT